MDERAKQFRTAAEASLKGDPLVKEINTLRRFLFRNQEYRFTKSAQMSLYMAILAHHANPAAFDSSKQEAPIARLLDDALKMPFTVFTSSQKDKLLSLYWGVLGEGEEVKRNGPSIAAPPATIKSLVLMDIESGNPPRLVLMRDDGAEYDRTTSAEAVDLSAIQAAFDAGKEVRVTVQEGQDNNTATVLDVEVVEDDDY